MPAVNFQTVIQKKYIYIRTFSCFFEIRALGRFSFTVACHFLCDSRRRGTNLYFRSALCSLLQGTIKIISISLVRIFFFAFIFFFFVTVLTLEIFYYLKLFSISVD